MLDYPSKDGNWTWEELALLAKACGYYHNIFYENVVVENRTKLYLKIEHLKFLLDGDKLYPHLHKTYNHQNGTYNIKVILKAIELLMHRYISFSCLRKARVAFQTYEHTDHAGLEDRFVLRAMQFCGKTMSPIKFKQILRHMGRLVADRLMLYEFIELLASADDISTVKQELPDKKDARGSIDDRKLYELCNFEDELSTPEQRYYKYLDQKYEDSRRVISVEESANDTNAKKIQELQDWVIPPLANQTIRKEMCLSNRVQSLMLKEHLDLSSTNVKRRGCSIPCTCEAHLVSSLIKSENTSKPSFVSVDGEPPATHSPIISKKLNPIVSDKDFEDTVREIESIQWDIAIHSQTRKMESPHSSR